MDIAVSYNRILGISQIPESIPEATYRIIDRPDYNFSPELSFWDNSTHNNILTIWPNFNGFYTGYDSLFNLFILTEVEYMNGIENGIVH